MSVKVKITAEDGRVVEYDMPKNVYNSLFAKKTGYEIIPQQANHYYVDTLGYAMSISTTSSTKERLHHVGNLYSNRKVAENNARAEKLFRNLRRYAVEHREEELDWDNNRTEKYCIISNTATNPPSVRVDYALQVRSVGEIYFDKRETALDALEKYEEEIAWYFTEYQDSL